MAFNLEDYEDVATLTNGSLPIIQWVDLIYQLSAMILKRVISWCKQPCGEMQQIQHRQFQHCIWI
jgi:hypothetical protein